MSWLEPADDADTAQAEAACELWRGRTLESF